MTPYLTTVSKYSVRLPALVAAGAKLMRRNRRTVATSSVKNRTHIWAWKSESCANPAPSNARNAPMPTKAVSVLYFIVGPPTDFADCPGLPP